MSAQKPARTIYSLFLFLVTALASITGPNISFANPETTQSPTEAEAQSTPPRVKLETNLGAILIELEPKAAPATVANFLAYVENGFYVNTQFHRVIPGFMVQGGGLDLDLMPKKAHAPIPNESQNGLANLRGTIAMARTTHPDSATSQFYINLVDNPHLDGRPGTPGYTVFGRVIEGMDVVDRIAEIPTGSRNGLRNVPLKPVIILRAVRQ